MGSILRIICSILILDRLYRISLRKFSSQRTIRWRPRLCGRSTRRRGAKYVHTVALVIIPRLKLSTACIDPEERRRRKRQVLRLRCPFTTMGILRLDETNVNFDADVIVGITEIFDIHLPAMRRYASRSGRSRILRAVNIYGRF